MRTEGISATNWVFVIWSLFEEISRDMYFPVHCHISDCYMPVRELRSTSFSVIPVTSSSFPSCLRHSRHFSVTAVSLFYLPFIIVFHRLSVFHLSSIPSLRIYSAPFMFRASFLRFVATLSYFNIFTFLWLDNKFIVLVIL